MPNSLPAHHLELRTLITAEGMLHLSLENALMPTVKPDEVLIQVQATPINPSDIGLLFGAADMSRASLGNSPSGATNLQAPVSPAAMKAMAPRLGQSLTAGNEGAGTVVAAGSAESAQALIGNRVAAIPGAMYSQYRAVKADLCMVLPDNASVADGASCYVNPLTALGMVETMRLEGHKAIIHTAAASNLGQMLNKICMKDGVALVNIVRGDAQAKVLKDLGAQYVCNSSASTFMQDLTDAIVATNATIAFDAIGGGALAGQILTCMEAAIARNNPQGFSRYGSEVLKQVYIYGGLDTGSTYITRNFGMTWAMGGFLLWPFLNRVGPLRAGELKQRVMSELKTTFASNYTREISLAQMLDLTEIAAYNKRATGEKFLVNPSLD